MATGDQTDIVARLTKLLPYSWFESAFAIRDAIAEGMANAHAYAYSLLMYVKQQTRILTASDGFLDAIAQDFFGSALTRATNQSDASFRARIIINIFRERATRNAIIKVLQDLTGRTPIIIEPQRPADTGTYGGTDAITVVSAQIYRNDWQGNQLLYATARTNLVLQSQTFTNAAWNQTSNGLASVTGSAGTAPDGTNTSFLLTENASSGNHLILATSALTIVAGNAYTVSVFAKAGARSKIGLYNTTSNNGFHALFDLSAGTVISYGSDGTGTGLGASILALGNGWYRCSCSGKLDPAATALNPRFDLLNAAGSNSYTGDGVSGLYVWGAQIESGATQTSYIPTTTAAVTATDYVLASNGAVTFAAPPAQGSALTWTGSYTSAIQGTTVSVNAAPFSTGDGFSTQFTIAPKYGYFGGYSSVGAYGSVLLQYQAFVIAYRPAGAGIPYVAGYGSSPGGYSQASRAEYADLSLTQNTVSDADIYAAIDSVKPAGTIIWTNISS
jgi:hypothetical protein